MGLGGEREESPIKPQWQRNRARQMGLRREKLPYDHMLEQQPTSAQRSTSAEEDAIYAQPKSDSSKSSSPGLVSASPEPDTPSSTKRRRLEPSGSSQIDLTSPSPEKKPRVLLERNSVQPSNIRSTQFTTSSSQASRVDDGNVEDPFAEFKSSQSKSARTYAKQGPANIHKAPYTKIEKPRPKKEPQKVEKAVKTGVDGFKTMNTEAFPSLGVLSTFSHVWLILILCKPNHLINIT